MVVEAKRQKEVKTLIKFAALLDQLEGPKDEHCQWHKYTLWNLD